MKNETTLVIMAAGMGSRFGGLKQITPFGPNGESIIDFSVYDAVKAGFSKVVVIIKKAIEKDFREVTGKRLEKAADVHYVFQEQDMIPAGFTVPEGRKKPWGTAHAVYCARNEVTTPFAVINADDYYGQKSFKVLNDFLSEEGKMCMVGFTLGNTITDYGTVSRGVCEAENGYLKGVTEVLAIDKNSNIPMNSIVSMNMWGFNTDLFDVLENKFGKFLKTMKDPEKSEFFIPTVVDELIKEENKKVKILTTDDKWYGITYKEDAPYVKKAIDKMIAEGKYNF